MNLKKNMLAASSLALVLSVNLFADELYTIENKTLKEALEIISKKSNLSYIANDKLFKSQKVNNIKNIESLEKALKALFKNTGLKAVIKNDVIVILEKSVKNKSFKSNNLGEIDILASVKEGSSLNGYLVKNIDNLGPWKGRSLQDIPYSLNVMSEDLIKNIQATSSDQIYNMNPVVQVNRIQSQNNNSYVNLRGFKATTVAFDGMRREKWQFAHNLNVEEYDRLETITGLSGFLYGPASIGGIMNYSPKRSTFDEQYGITLGNAGGKGYYVHADLSAPIDNEGKLAYRLNVVSQDGNTHVDNQNLKRSLINLALDYRVSDNLLLQGYYSKSDYRLDGRQAYWYLESGAKRPSASKIDSNKLWGQKWTYQESDVSRYSANLLWNVSENINVRAAYMNEKVTREGFSSDNNINADGTYYQETWNDANIEDELHGDGANIFTDISLSTGKIKHDVTIGMQTSSSYMNDQDYDDSSSLVTLNGLNLNSPTYVNAPQESIITGSNEEIYYLKSTNFTLGDSITFNPQWSLLLGVSHMKLEYKDNNYKKTALTPSASLIYKPIPELTTYVTYMEGLEVGGIADDTYNGQNVTNAKEAMNPLKSTQIEIGTKYSFNDMLFTASLFEIDKGLEYYDDTIVSAPIFVQDGRQVHRGFEFTFTGKLTDKLTAIGGLTLLDAQVKKNKQNPNLVGKTPREVSDKFAKLYLEYTPFESSELSFNGGLNYTGSFYGDNKNADKLPSYTLYNLGAKYTIKNTKNPLTLRLNINNITDEEYWVNTNYLGDRRTVHASVSMKF